MSDVTEKHIPTDIVREIFTRLPVKSLLRFRCACKPWLTLISSPDFVKSHLHRNTTTKSNTCVVTSRSNTFPAYTLDCRPLDRETAVDFNNQLEQKFGFDVVSSVNGIVCVVSTNGVDVLLWNPSTRKKLEVPPPGDVREPQDSNYGLGYDSVRDDYKLVRLRQGWSVYRNGDVVLLWDFRIFSVKSMAWTRKEGFPFPLLYDKGRIPFVRGALHWFLCPATSPEEAQQIKNADNLIAAFDVHTEDYLLFNLPKYASGIIYMALSELDGRLGLYCDYRRSFVDVWVMTKYGVNESWIRLISVYQCQFVMPLCYSMNGEKILLEKNKTGLAWYDIEGREVEESGVRGNTRFARPTFVYVESLVRLPGESAVGLTNQKEGNQKNANNRYDTVSQASTN